MNVIDQPAIIETEASIAEGTTVGSACYIGKHVIIGKNNHIDDHVVITGHTTIGDNNYIASYTVLGTAPQDIKPTSADVSLIIGDHNEIGSHVLISCGTDGGGKVTHIGNHNKLMDYTHIGHDVQMGNSCVMQDESALGGHVIVQDHVYFARKAAVHQFVEIGAHSKLEEDAALTQDLPPYCVVSGNRAKITGLHHTHLKTIFTQDQMTALSEAYQMLFESHNSPKESALKALEQCNSDILKELYQCIAHSKRGIPFKRNENVN